MTNTNNDNESNCILEIDENVMPGTWNENLQYRLASERNRLRWEHQEKYEKAAIEMYINEDAVTKQRKSIRMAVEMSEIVLNIQEALHSDTEHDLPKAIESLKKLIKEPFTTMSLLYAPCVVKTVYLCCRYVKSSEIRALAEKCYVRFRPCFGVLYGETFETTFQTAVRNFWEKQNTVICDTTKYDYRQFTMNDDVPIEIGNSMERENSEKIKIGLNSDKSLAIKEEIVKAETGDSQYFKRQDSEEIEFNVDNKSLVEETAMEIKAECETETDELQYDCNIIVKEEIMDTDEIEIPNCTIKPESVSDMLQITIKSEPTDLENLYAKYEPENCSIKLESTSDIRDLSVILEPINFEKLNIEYDSGKDCYILNSH